MLNAFRRSTRWRAALLQPTLYVFDEQFGTDGPSMVDVYRDMWVAGKLAARPTRALLVQDMVRAPRSLFTVSHHPVSPHLSLCS